MTSPHAPGASVPHPLAASASAMIDRATERLTARDVLASLIQFRELVRNLVLRELKLKYRGSVLGFVWSLVNPTATLLIYSVAFRYILPTGTDRFVFLLAIGLLAWQFFGNAAVMSTAAMLDAGGLIRSIAVPRAAMPVAVVLFTLAQYLLTMVVLLPILMVVDGGLPGASVVLFPVVLALQVIFTVGVALVLSVATVHFRDTKHLVDLGLSLCFWLTPVVYRVQGLAEPLRTVLRFSPLAPFITAYQDIFYARAWPASGTLALAVVYAGVSAFAGLRLFLATEQGLAERV